MPPGKNSSKTEGYWRMNSMGRKGMRSDSLLWVSTGRGSDLEGSDLIKFLMFRSG